MNKAPATHTRGVAYIHMLSQHFPWPSSKLPVAQGLGTPVLEELVYTLLVHIDLWFLLGQQVEALWSGLLCPFFLIEVQVIVPLGSRSRTCS